VQVVPMTQTLPSRGASRHNRSQSHAADTSEYVAAQGSQYPAYASGPAAAPAAAPSSTSSVDPNAGYYQQAGAAGPDAGDYGAGSETGYSEGEYMMDARGVYLRDEHGNKIPFHSPSASPSRATGRRADAGPEDYETPTSQAPTSYPPSSSHWAGPPPGAPEYAGQGYAAPGWETLPRHHHPTRLSDVIEEDERSRTSVSQVSRA
jgi:hypothetical protein